MRREILETIWFFFNRLLLRWTYSSWGGRGLGWGFCSPMSLPPINRSIGSMVACPSWTFDNELLPHRQSDRERGAGDRLPYHKRRSRAHTNSMRRQYDSTTAGPKDTRTQEHKDERTKEQCGTYLWQMFAVSAIGFSWILAKGILFNHQILRKYCNSKHCQWNAFEAI